MTHKPASFRLSLLGAGETLPRMIRAYGKACDGTFALVMRPREESAVLVHLRKAQKGQPESATIWRRSLKSDAPQIPRTEIAPMAAAAAIRELQKDPPAAGAVTLKGQWSGSLHCENGTPRVELRRKVASYGTLVVESREGGWQATFQREARWFSGSAVAESVNKATLKEAIAAGLQVAMKQVCGACTVRDTERRQARDAAYAAQKPIQPPKEGKDPTARLKVKAPREKAPSKAEPLKKPQKASAPVEDWKAPIEARLRAKYGDLSGLKGVLENATHAFAGAKERWKTLRAEGADNPTLQAALSREFGQGGGGTHPTKWSIQGGKSPLLIAGEKKLRGVDLLDLTRITLDLSSEKVTSLKEDHTAKPPSPPAPLEAPVHLPPVPKTAEAVEEMAETVSREAEVLAALPDKSWAWSESGAKERAARWLEQHELEPWADALRGYDGHPERPLQPFLEEQIRSLDSYGKATKLDPKRLQEARGHLMRLEFDLQEAPLLLERTRKLIRYTARMTESKLCQGGEQREAREALEKAVRAYERAREVILQGGKLDGITLFRHIGEHLALSAARAARACAAGQQSLMVAIEATPRPTPPEAPPKHKQRVEVPPPSAEGAAPKKRARKPKADAGALVDESRDRALLGMFQSAIAEVLKAGPLPMAA